MSMHLHHPSLSLNGHRRGKAKFRNAEQAKQARELELSWAELKSRWQPQPTAVSRSAKTAAVSGLVRKISAPPGRESTRHIPSVDSGAKGAVSSKPAQQYTGTKIIGIGTLHKSNAVPVFSDEEAIDMAKMRR
jgi:hypothetical protein